MTERRDEIQRRAAEERRQNCDDFLASSRPERRLAFRRAIDNARTNHMTADFFERYHTERRRLGL